MPEERMEPLDFKDWVQLAVMMILPVVFLMAEIGYIHVNVLRLMDRVNELEACRSLHR